VKRLGGGYKVEKVRDRSCPGLDNATTLISSVIESWRKEQEILIQGPQKMTRLDLIADEASLLRAYNLSTLTPTQWEDVDHDLDEDSGVALPGALTSSSLANAERDPLGLGSVVDIRDTDFQSSLTLPKPEIHTFLRLVL
jgi:hypothetical protein